MLAGEASEEAIAARCSKLLGKRWRWLRPLARRYLSAFGAGIPPRRQRLLTFLQDDPGLTRACALYQNQILIKDWLGLLDAPQTMQPAPVARSWNLSPIESTGALAAWLGLSFAELEWFADLRGWNEFEGASLSHYHYRLLHKDSGTFRLIEAPKEHLKQLQRKILTEILEQVPVHNAAHGFVRGRSTQSFAAPHVCRQVILKMDLQDFFPSVSAGRVRAFFRVAGYPESVADRLGGICTNSAPDSIWKQAGSPAPALQAARDRYARPHLPQGAPSSPALANICFYHADCRLSGLAANSGAVYTRYADDLAFSGDDSFARGVESFAARVAAIVAEEGFAVHFRKTRVMRQGVRQYLAGLVTNQRLNVMRADFDRLKATLTNCVRHGPESQNRDGHAFFREHLEGRVGFVESVHPAKGQRLRQILNQIEW